MAEKYFSMGGEKDHRKQIILRMAGNVGMRSVKLFEPNYLVCPLSRGPIGNMKCPERCGICSICSTTFGDVMDTFTGELNRISMGNKMIGRISRIQKMGEGEEWRRWALSVVIHDSGIGQRKGVSEVSIAQFAQEEVRGHFLFEIKNDFLWKRNGSEEAYSEHAEELPRKKWSLFGRS